MSNVEYKPGDVANGHVLTSDGQWVQQQAAYVPAKKSGMPTWLKVILALFAAGLILTIAAVACSAALIGGAAKSVSDNEKPGKTSVPLGQPGKAGDMTFTVTSVKTGAAVGDQFSSVKAQGTFVLVTVKMTNTSAKPKTPWSSAQYLFDSKGAKFSDNTEAEVMANPSATDPWNSEINPGNSVVGVLVFDVPVGDTLSTLVVHDGLTSGGKATMSLH